MYSRQTYSSRWIAINLLLPVLMLLVASRSACQQPNAAAVITDGQAPDLSDRFSMPPTQFKLADTGKVFFASGGATAVFQWDQERGAPERLVQTNDRVEALGTNLPGPAAGALMDSTGRLLQTNAAGHAAILISAAVKSTVDPAGIFLFDGASYREMKTPLDSFSQLALNNLDKAAVLGSLTLPRNIFPGPGLYIAGPDMQAVEIAQGGKPAPAAIGGTYSNIRQLIGINDAGQVAFVADVNGGNAQRAVFLYDGEQVGVVAKSGTVPGTFQNFVIDTPPSGVSYALNNNGKVAFRASAVGENTGIWVGGASGVPTKIAGLGDPTGVEELGNCNVYVWLRGFDDSDRALYDCLAMPGSRNALFLKGPSDAAPQVVFKRGQSLGAAGNFVATQQASLNAAGKIVCLAALTGGSSPMAWFLVSGDADPVKIAAEGEATPAGGTFGLAGTGTPALINSGGQVVFVADILKSNAAGLFSWTSGGGVTPVATSMDAMPEGANTVLRAGPPAASDTETVVKFLKAGGQSTFYARSLDPSASGLRKIVSEFEEVPDLGGVAGLDNLAMNSKGEAIFTAALLGPKNYPATGILASLPDTGLQKVVCSGDRLAGGDAIASLSSPQLNNQSQVAFQAAIVASGQATQSQGVFIAPITPAADGIVAVVRQGDAIPGGGAFDRRTNVFGGIVLNDGGQVAFRGIADVGNRVGIFVGSGGGKLFRVAMMGDAVAPGVAFGANLGTFRINAAGQIAFIAGLTGASTSGVFLAAPGEAGYTPQALAMSGDRAPVSGSSPGFALFREDALELSNSGKVAFWAGLSDSSVGGGWFVGSSPADLSPRLLSTQELSNNVRIRAFYIGKGGAAVSDSGELAVYISDINGSDIKPRILIGGPNGAFRTFALNGAKAGNTGSEFGKLYPGLTATPGGRFLFSAVLLNGPARAGIFISGP